MHNFVNRILNLYFILVWHAGGLIPLEKELLVPATSKLSPQADPFLLKIAPFLIKLKIRSAFPVPKGLTEVFLNTLSWK